MSRAGKLFKRTKRAIMRQDVQFKQSARSLKKDLNLESNPRTVQHALPAAPHVKSIKQTSSVKLFDKQNSKQIDCAKNYNGALWIGSI